MASENGPSKTAVQVTETEIELGDNRNRVVMFPPTREKLRGHWLRQHMTSDEMTESLANMPDLPGIRLRIDPTKRVGVAFDPLSLPENESILRRAESVHKEVFHIQATAMKPVEYKSLDDTDVKSWLYWMRRLVDNGQARVTKGRLPTLGEIESLPGKTQMEAWNSSARACKFREDYEAHIGLILNRDR